MNFSDLENSDDSTIFYYFQFNKYANQRIHKSIDFKNLNGNRPAIVNFKNYAFVCLNKSFKLKLTLIRVYAIKFINPQLFNVKIMIEK